jgi:hypothetical protein
MMRYFTDPNFESNPFFKKKKKKKKKTALKKIKIKTNKPFLQYENH